VPEVSVVRIPRRWFEEVWSSSIGTPACGRLRQRHGPRSWKSGEASLRGEFRQRVFVGRISAGVLSRVMDAASNQLLLAA
jgi:hypothetical protein